MNPSYQELLAQREALLQQQAALARKISEARKASQVEVIAKIKALMGEHGLTAADLMQGGGRGDVRLRTQGRAAAIKFRNHDTGETWAGRGKRPRWLVSALAAGRSLEDFAV